MKSRIDPVILRTYLLAGVILVLAGLLTVSWWIRLQRRRNPQPVVQSTVLEESPVAEIPAPPRPPRAPAGVRLAEELVGIGAELRMDAGQLRVMGVVPDSPAARAGLAGGSVIRAVDGVDLAGLRLQECVDRIRGPIGSKVRLELINPTGDATNAVELTREKLRL